MVVSVLSMDEFEIIKNYFKRESFRSDVLLGIGDDGAVLDLKALDNENLVMSTDTLVAVSYTHLTLPTIYSV